MHRFRDEDVQALTDTIYDAAIDPDRWSEALNGVVDFVGGSGCHLACLDRRVDRIDRDVYVNMPERLMHDYNREMVTRCPRVTNGLDRPIGELCYDFQYTDERAIAKDPYYDWLRRTGDGIRYHLAGRLSGGHDQLRYVSLAFRAEEGHPQQEHMRRFAAVLPHIDRAIRLSAKLATAGLGSHPDLSLVNLVTEPLFLVDRDRTLLHMNESADETLRTGTVCGARRRRLFLVDRVLDARFGKALEGVFGATPTRHDATLNARQLVDRGDLRIGVSRLQLRVGPFEPPLVCAAVLLRRSERRLMTREEFAARHELTAAELAIVGSFVAGNGVAATAALRGTTVGTVRSQLKSVFRKTGTRRQGELIALALNSIDGETELGASGDVVGGAGERR